MTLWKPHAYQKRAVKFMVQQGAGGLLLDPGLGKTSISLAAASLFFEKKLHRAALVIAPLRPCYSVWPAEIEKWTDFAHLKFSILHGKHKLEALKAKADIYIINPEGLGWLFETLKKEFRRKDWPFDILIVDESSKFRRTSTLRFRTLKPELRRFARRYILTGTPAPKGLLNLFGQVFILDQGASLGLFFTHYRGKYFDKGGWGGLDFTIKPGVEKEIYKKIKPLMLRLAAEDYITLPPLVPANIYVDLPEKARIVYDKMESDFFAKLDSGTVTAFNAGVASYKCRQVASGGVFHDRDATLDEKQRRWTHLHEAKSEAMINLLDELEGQPALIAYEWHHDLERIKAALKKGGYGDVPHIGGGVSPKKGAELERAWNRGELSALIGHPQSVAWGLNLQGHGRAIIWHTLTYDLEMYTQFIRRIWRQGQTGTVFNYHILAKNTVDDAVLGTLARKDRTQKALLDALRSYRASKRTGAP